MEKKDRFLQVRLTEGHRQKLQDLANALGIDRSQLIREMIDSTKVSGETRLLVGAGK